MNNVKPIRIYYFNRPMSFITESFGGPDIVYELIVTLEHEGEMYTNKTFRSWPNSDQYNKVYDLLINKNKLVAVQNLQSDNQTLRYVSEAIVKYPEIIHNVVIVC